MGAFVLIDGHYYAYRFFFGMPRLTGRGGRPTGVTFAMAKLLKDLIDDPDVSHVAAVFDDSAPTFRHDLFPDYKAHRDPMPEELKQQVPDIQQLVQLHGIPLIQVPGYEADDIIATLAKQGAAAGLPVRICSRDKDLDQVLSTKIQTWEPGKNRYRGPADLESEKGIRPDQVIDYLCMLGDTADNVPGIKGVGQKTATKLLQEFGSLQMVLERSDLLKGKRRENVEAFKTVADLTRQLITLVDVPDLPDLKRLACPTELAAELRPFYTELGFREQTFFPLRIQAATSDASAYRTLGSDDLPHLAVQLQQAGRFAIDTETTSLEPLSAEIVGISLAWGEADGRGSVYLPVAGTEHQDLIPLAAIREHLGPVLADASIGKIAQNCKYDLRILRQHELPLQGLDGDPMLASWLLDPGRNMHGLDVLTRDLLHETKITTEQVVDLKAGQTMAAIPVATVATYACEDAQCTWRLAQVLEKRLQQNNLFRVYQEQELPLAACLADIEQTGMGIDAMVLAQQEQNLQAYLDQVQRDITSIAGSSFNPASPKQVGQLLFEKLGLPVLKKNKGGPSTDAGVLNALRHQHEVVDLLLQHRALSKLLGTYIRSLPGSIHPRTGRIHSTFKQTGTETGRLSSEHPNLQNIPKRSELGRELRAAFVAKPGHLLLGADYSQIELRVLAHFSGDPALCDAFANDTDIHRYVAAQVNDCDEDSVTPAMRSAAKAINFGLIYGQSAFGLAAQIGVSRHEAQQFIDAYFSRFREVLRFKEDLIVQAKNRGYVSTLAGRRRYIPLLQSSNGNERRMGERTALNSTIQGSAADLIKQAMLRCRRSLPTDCQLVIQIHDELIIEAPDQQADAAANALHTAMVDAWQLNVPLIAEVRRGRNWLDIG
jgi:DNA polymerase I